MVDHAFRLAAGEFIRVAAVLGLGAAVGAGMGVGYYKTAREAFANTKPLNTVEPDQNTLYDGLYHEWKELLEARLSK